MNRFFLFLFSLLGLFFLTSCGKEGIAMNAAEPETGYEETIRFDIGGVHLNVPYGYLYKYARKDKGQWPKGDGQRYPVMPLNIMVAEREHLAPYASQTRHHFEDYFSSKGSDAVSVLIYDRKECDDLDQEQSKQSVLRRGYHKLEGLQKNYIGFYEIYNEQYTAKILFNDGNEKTTINLDSDKINGKYSAQIFSCKNGLYVHYYLDYEYSETPPIDEVIGFKDRLNSLIGNMIQQ